MIPEEMIGTGRITLRALEESDASERYAAWLNDPGVNQYLETRAVSVDDLRRYIREKRESPEAIFFGIFWKCGTTPGVPLLGKEGGGVVDTHIGNVKLEPIDAEKATMGILIGDKNYWGKGIATEVTNIITEYAFGALGLLEVNLGVIAQNQAAIRVYEKCGFVAERIEKDAINHDGKTFDQVFMKRCRMPNAE